MTVDTSSADDSALGAEPLATEAAVAAGESVLENRFGSSITLVEPEDLAGTGPATVVRARVAASSFALPQKLVIKHFPAVFEDERADPFAHEAVSYQLFMALAPDDRMCPEMLAHDGDLRVLVLDDLGDASTLQDKLFTDADASAAEAALLSWARSLGRLHASTADRDEDFQALLRRLGGTLVADDSASTACAQLPVLLEETLGVRTPSEVSSRATRTAQAQSSGSYRAFSPVDLSPDNNLVTEDGVQFLDFERGRVRNALADAACLRTPFSACADARALPAGMSEAMVAVWRAEVAAIWPALSDEDTLSAYLLDSQLLRVVVATAQVLPELDSATTHRSVGPAPALVGWWRELATQAERIGASELAEYAGRVAAGLDARFGPGLELALYPAFR